jgi:AcrR family transcriptional regulator
MARSVELPAPGRGAYDRSLSRPERDTQHRERLMRAVAEILLEGNVTLARIVERAGVGRSTFYEFFDSPEHLVAHLEQRRRQSLEQALTHAFGGAHTPLERLRAIVRSFVAELEAHPLEGRVLLTRRREPALLSLAGQALHHALEQTALAARRDGVSPLAGSDDLLLLAAAASIEALTHRHLVGPALREAPRVLTDVALKLLR